MSYKCALKPDFIDNFIKRISLDKRGFKNKIVEYYFNFYEKHQLSQEAKLKKITRFRKKSPLHKSSDLYRWDKIQQARCVLYAALLALLNSKDWLHESDIEKLFRQIPYESWKKQNFDLFPTKLYFSPSSLCETNKKDICISFWDIINAPLRSFEEHDLDSKKRIKTSCYINIKLLKSYCINQTLTVADIRDFKCHQEGPFLCMYLYDKAKIGYNREDICQNNFYPHLFKVSQPIDDKLDPEGKIKENLNKINSGLYKGLLMSINANLESASGKGYTTTTKLPKNVNNKKRFIAAKDPWQFHSDYAKRLLDIAIKHYD